MTTDEGRKGQRKQRRAARQNLELRFIGLVGEFEWRVRKAAPRSCRFLIAGLDDGQTWQGFGSGFDGTGVKSTVLDMLHLRYAWGIQMKRPFRQLNT